MNDTLSEVAPETEEEYRERREELIGDAQESKRELEQAQNEALSAIASGEDLERYETVTLGDLELEVKAWLPGDTTATVQRAMELAEGDDLKDIQQSMEVMLSALSDMTKSDTYNLGFWKQYYQKWGPEGLMVAVEAVLTPANEAKDEKEEAIGSFRGAE